MKSFVIITIVLVSSFCSYSQVSTGDFSKAKHIASLFDKEKFKHINLDITTAKYIDTKFVLSKDVKSVSAENGLLKIEYDNGRVSWLDENTIYSYEIRPDIGVMIVYLSY